MEKIDSVLYKIVVHGGLGGRWLCVLTSVSLCLVLGIQGLFVLGETDLIVTKFYNLDDLSIGKFGGVTQINVSFAITRFSLVTATNFSRI